MRAITMGTVSVLISSMRGSQSPDAVDTRTSSTFSVRSNAVLKLIPVHVVPSSSAGCQGDVREPAVLFRCYLWGYSSDPCQVEANAPDSPKVAGA